MVTKNAGWVFKKVVNRIEFNETTSGGPSAGEAGFLDRANVEITLEPRLSDELIDGQKYQLGYLLSFKIRSIQFLSVHEFDKMKNKEYFISIPEIPLWLLKFNLNISGNWQPGATGYVEITGSKFIEKISHGLASKWTGEVFLPFDPGTGILPEERSYTQPAPGTDSPADYDYVNEYVLNPKDPLQEFIDPAKPDQEDSINEIKLAIVYSVTQVPVEQAPTVFILSYFNGISWVPFETEDYALVYEKGEHSQTDYDNAGAPKDLTGVIYKIHLSISSQSPLKLGSRLALNFNFITEIGSS